MTFDQIASAAAHGKLRKGMSDPTREQVFAMARQWRMYLPSVPD